MPPSDLARALEVSGQILVTEVTNEARLDCALAAGVERVQWSAILEGGTCPLCGALDGKVFRAADHPFDPPAHINCRCIWIERDADEVGPVDWFDPGEEGSAQEDRWVALMGKHGHFFHNEESYRPLRIPAAPEGRDFIVRRVRDPETGELRTVVEWRRPRYELDLPPSPATGRAPAQTGVSETGQKWQPLGAEIKPPLEPRDVPGHPELLTETDRLRYEAHFTAGPQPRAIPPTAPGPAGHVGSLGEFTWNPADNDLSEPMPEGMRLWLEDLGYVGEAAEEVRRQLWRWSDRQYNEEDVQKSVTDFVRQAPKYEGRIERHLSLPVNDGEVDLEAYLGGTLEEGGSIKLAASTCFTAGHRTPGNVVLVVDRNTQGASIRGFVQPESLVEDEIVVPRGTEYEVLNVQEVEWLRPGNERPEKLVVVRLRESDVSPR